MPHRVDDQWHHITLTWVFESGETQLYFDGVQRTPFWNSSAGNTGSRRPELGGVSRNIGKLIERADQGMSQSQGVNAVCRPWSLCQ